MTILRRGVPDRVGVTTYELSGLDSGRPMSDPGYAELARMQRELGDVFAHAGADFGTGVGDPNVVAEGSADLSASQRQTTTIPTPKGDLTASARRDPGNLTWWQIKALIESPEDCRRWLSLPAKPSNGDASDILRLQRELGEEGLVLAGPGDALGLVCGMFHYDRFAMILLEDEGLIVEMLAAMSERLNDGLRKLCPQVKGVCFRFWGPEYSGAPLLNPHKYFGKLVVDFDKEAVRIVNESGNFSIIHAHGYLSGIIDGIIELHPTALEPLEVAPAKTADVTIEQLKVRLGGKMALMGGIQAGELELLAPRQVDARVKEILAVAAKGGGFCLLPTSAPIEVPLRPAVVENYRAYFHAAHKYGTY